MLALTLTSIMMIGHNPLKPSRCDSVLRFISFSKNPVESAFWIEYFASEIGVEGVKRSEERLFTRIYGEKADLKIDHQQEVRIWKHLKNAEAAAQ